MCPFWFSSKVWLSNMEEKQRQTIEAIERKQNKAMQKLNFKGPCQEADNWYKKIYNKIKNTIAHSQLVYDQL